MCKGKKEVIVQRPVSTQVEGMVTPVKQVRYTESSQTAPGWCFQRSSATEAKQSSQACGFHYWVKAEEYNKDKPAQKASLGSVASQGSNHLQGKNFSHTVVFHLLQCTETQAVKELDASY